MKIVIGIPSTGMWHSQFAMDLMGLMMYTMSKTYKGEKINLQVQHVRGSILPKQRRELVMAAEAAKADYMLWLDCDHTFPHSLLLDLLKHGKDIMAVNCVTKSTPANPTARLKSEDVETGIACFSLPSKGIEKVWRVGTGVMLVNMKVYKATGPDIFHMFYRPEVDNYQGEDWTMCEAMEKAGFDIWVDHQVSLNVGHIGFLEYKHDLVPETAFYEAKQARLGL